MAAAAIPRSARWWQTPVPLPLPLPISLLPHSHSSQLVSFLTACCLLLLALWITVLFLALPALQWHKPQGSAPCSTTRAAQARPAAAEGRGWLIFCRLTVCQRPLARTPGCPDVHLSTVT